MKKAYIISAVLLCAVLLSGCSEGGNTVEVQSSGLTEQTQTSESVEQTTVITPDVPDGLDFESHNFVIVNNDYSIPIWSQRDIASDELTGDIIEDAVFNRNFTIEEKYNCTIESRKVTDPTIDVRKAISSGDNGIDVVTYRLRSFPVSAQEKILVDLKTVQSMDMTKPWYDVNSASDLSVCGKLFGVVTDLTIMDEEATTAMVFNKQLYEDLGLSDKYGSMYDMVSDGKWVFDTMAEIVTSISADLNGDGVIDKDDRYGLLYQRDSLTGMLNACGVSIADKNSDDIPMISFMDESGTSMLDKLFSFLYLKDNCFNVMVEFTGDEWSDQMINMFANNQSIFMWIRLADVENLRSVDTDFGIIPQPKRDEAQSDYLSSVNPYVGVVTSIPISAYDVEKTGMFIEVISAESRNQLLPAYYEKNLQGKITRDEESSAMLDIILNNRIYDIGQIYDIGNFADTLIYMTMKYDSDYASKYAKSETSISKKLNTMIEKFSELD